jgi:hypothetical protein
MADLNLECSVSNNTPRWRIFDLVAWKAIPQRWNGGDAYILRFKDTWVRHNRLQIKNAASSYNYPAALLAGVCWNEVGGDPEFIDSMAFSVRSFNWSGPDWIDKHLTITIHPAKTSFGAVSMQIKTAAKTLGVDPNSLSTHAMRRIANCLEQDVYNISIVAFHLRQLIDYDKLQTTPSELSSEAIQIAGIRYNRGTELALEKIKQENTDYGDRILKNWAHLESLLK